MNKRTIFITGTDTNVGKTYISTGILGYFKRCGYKTLGLKPIASGCNNQGSNDDALQLMQESTKILSYKKTNLFALKLPVAPHLAAKAMHVSLSISKLHQAILPLLSIEVDICLIEGAGGWLVPLNAKETYADWVVSCDMEIILVVKMTLGCINHALLTVESILRQHGKLIGWIANCPLEMMDCFNENIETLTQWLPVPHMGTVLPGQDPSVIFSEVTHPLMKTHE